MDNEKIITGIDIGTTKIVVVIAEKKDNAINILGIGKSDSKGLNKGIVIDIDVTVQSLESAIIAAEKESKISIESAYVGITGENIKGINIPLIRKWVTKYVMWVFNIYLDSKYDGITIIDEKELSFGMSLNFHFSNGIALFFK